MDSLDDMKRTEEEGTVSVVAIEDDGIKHEDEVEVSEFNYSVDKYFDVNDKIFSLCGSTSDEQVADAHAVKHFSLIVTFLPEWRIFQYEPANFKFNYDLGSSGGGEDTTTDIHLSQFSSASVPKRGRGSDKSTELNSKDFLLHAGGSVWSLDWCPRVGESHDSCNNFEYLAVSAHPPGSSQHRMGLPLTGRGIIQIWGILSVKREEASSSMYKFSSNGRGRPRKRPLLSENKLNSLDENTTWLPNTSRGRPRNQRKPGESSKSAAVLPKSSGGIPSKQLEFMDSSKVSNEVVLGSPEAHPKIPRGRPRKVPGLTNLGYAGLKQLESIDSAKISNEVVLGSPEAHPKRPRGRPREVPRSTISGSAGLENCHGDFSLNLTLEDEVCLAEFISSYHREKQCRQESKGRPRKAPSSRKDSGLINQVSTSILAIVPEVMEFTDVTLTSSPALAKTDFPSSEQQYPRKRCRPRKNPSMDSSGTADSSPVTCLSASRSDNHALLKPSEHMVSHEEGRETGSSDFSYDENTNLHQSADFLSSKTVLLSSKNCPLENYENVDNSNFTERNSVYFPSGLNHLNSLHNGSLSRTTSGRERISKTKNGIFPSKSDAFSPTLSTIDEEAKSYYGNVPDFGRQCEGSWVSSHEVGDKVTSQNENVITDKDVTMPRVIFCLAHMGKVAWDVKWRPAAKEFKEKYTMGFLAVLLGDGSLEVWEVPLPSLIKKLYTSYDNKEGIDPRFVRLQPVFKCSKLSRGGKQSIPLVLEWSLSPPFDLILAGCHDGSVALWRFYKKDITQDANPLACFAAGNDPVRALAWCPDESDGENTNLFLTAGHEGLRFWDIRDPYRPLWRFNPVQRHILSVDWLKDLRSILVSYDDGDLRIIRLRTALSDTPVTGEVFGEAKPGTRTLARSSFAMWSAQASCNNGVVAYCCADGSTKRFELKMKNVQNVSLQRVRRFLCGSLMVMGNDLLIHTPLLNHALPVTQANRMQPQNKDSNKAGPNKGKIAASKRKSHSIAEREVLEKEIMCAMQEEELPDLQTETLEELPDLQTETFTPLQTIECFPSKRVAMHKVRWNKNRGSEQWLCYGGAAGIIRCQEITWPIP